MALIFGGDENASGNKDTHQSRHRVSRAGVLPRSSLGLNRTS